ncbi:MAG: tetratricopeptide repeat protein [Desulfobacterales bacterium]|nr:tetratricopeptide repeat protein [Desulfobacterales bacterium]
MNILILMLKIIIRLIIQPSCSYFCVVEKICKTELEKHPQDLYIKKFLANHYIQYKKYDEACFLLEYLISSEKYNRAVMLMMSKMYFNLGQYDKVEQLLSNSESLFDKDTANYYLGYSLIELGKVRDGIEYLNKYLKHHSKDYIVFWKLGYEYYKQRQYELALEAYRKSEKLNPSKKEIKDSIDLCIENIECRRKR